MPSSVKIISPGVFTNEIDQTFLPAAVGEIGAALIGPTVRGPAGIPTVVTSYSEYQAKFGDTFKSGSSYYQYLTSHTAKEYLKHSGQLTVIRVLAGSFGGASTTISSSVDPSTVGGGTYATGSFTVEAGNFGSDSTFHHSMSIGGISFVYTGSGWNPGVDANSSTSIFVVSKSNVTTTAAEFAAVINNADSSSLHGLSISASNAAGIVWLSSSKAGRMHGLDGLQIPGASAISGTLNLISSSIVAYTSINQLQGGTEFGSTQNSVTYKTPFKLHTLSDGKILNSGGDNNLGSGNILKSGSKNNLRYEITTRNNKKGSFTLLIRRGDDTEKRKQTLETWNNITLDENASNYISKIIGDQYYSLQGSGTTDPYLQLTGDYPNKSQYVRVETIEQTIDYLDENGNVRAGGAASASLPANGSGSSGGSFAGASDGTVQHPKNFYDNIADTNSQGLNLNVAASGKTSYEDAINLLGNQDEYDINLLMMPGVTDAGTGGSTLIGKAIDMCEDRGDCFVIADPTNYGGSISSATNEAAARDSSYAAMYYPWVQIRDADLGKSVWVPPSTVVGGIYAFNDRVAHPWFAPAGLNRGILNSAVQVERKLIHANRDTLYSSDVNSIATFPGQGITVWGQKTLQKKASALDRVNVRRLLIKLKKFIASTSRFLVFEQNTAATRRRFLNIVNPFMEQVQSNSGLTAFRVVMDETNNTPDTIDRNILFGQIFVQPTRTAEFIVLDFTVQPTGATFPE